jgi:hypothetical protein
MAIQFLPYALAALGGYRGYKDAKAAGASGIGKILGAGIGAFSGYNLGQVGGFAKAAGFGSTVPSFSQTGVGSALAQRLGMAPAMGSTYDEAGLQLGGKVTETNQGRTLRQILLEKQGGGYDPMKIAALAGGVPLALGAFNQGPTDIYMPGYNMGYLDLKEKRAGYTYIDPTTGEEKAYEKVYAPEEAGRDDPRMGAYSMNVQRLRVGGIAEIKKFNEGGVNYLPSKISHDEDDANNYVRASGYVEDGAGVGDKDEDTMLAQLADGEFVTRADGVLGAGIIAGANPNSMKDMREKGAQYFYEQQKRYKRVFDLLQDRNGISKQKTN